MTKPQPNNIWLLALTGGAIAAPINSVLALLAPTLIGQPIQIPNPNTQVLENLPLFAVITASLVPSFAAAGVLLLLRRLTATGTRIFQILGAVLALLSCIPTFTMPISPQVKIILSVMHLVAATSIVLTLTRPQKA
jgi:Family of unknown function (DUF6069)